ncbi:MAG: c-type cytochrome, partial [Pseudaminobacter sp.]|nr:c-type cytochrome [Pseudaminobacter sp.]
YAHFVKDQFGERYQRIFGELPDMAGIPANAGPLGTNAEKAAWNRMSADQRASIDRVFANIGKAFAAFGRSIVHEETRFDRFAEAVAEGREPEGEDAFSNEEMLGLRLFIGKANCVACHNGPRFTDDRFHNTGVPAAKDLPEDRGRETAVAELVADPFNCLGAFSDAGAEICGELQFMVKSGEALKRAYKTPSLRGAAGRPPYMHAGQIATLPNVVDHYSRAPASPYGTSEIAPLTLSEIESAALIAFLRTLAE